MNIAKIAKHEGMNEALADSYNGKGFSLAKLYFASLQAALRALLKRCLSKDLSLLSVHPKGEVA